MKKSTAALLLCLLLCLVLLTACGSKKNQEAAMPTPIIIYVTPEPATPAPETPAPAAEPTPVSQDTTPAETAAPPEATAPGATPTPTPTPAPATPTPAPTPGSAPTVTKSPTDERINEGGTCLFVARANNATSLVWHFVSPDGKTDVPYDSIYATFPQLSVSGGTESTLRLSNVPYSMNGWRVYCRFGNSYGNVSSGQAAVYVNAPVATPTPTPAPTPASTPAPAPEPAPIDYSGTYYEANAGRAWIEVSGSPNWYSVHVYWSGSAYEHAEWTFSGSFVDGSLYYSDCAKTTVSYDQDGIETITTDYTGGSGCLYTTATGALRWDDYQEGIADGLIFM